MLQTHSTVAIVDDDASVRRVLKRLLKTQQWEVDTYASAEEFLGRAPGRKLNLALVDIYLRD
jgi:FixJ family two-component response regulator